MKLIRWRKERSVYEATWFIDGKRKRKTLSAFSKSDQAQARAFAQHLYVKDLKGELSSECKITFNEMSDTYFTYRGKIRDTGKKYRMNIIKQFIGDKKLDRITHLDYEAFKKYLKEIRKLKNQSINTYLNDLGAVMNLSKKQRIIKDFPPILKLDKEEERERRDLTPDEIDIIRSVITPYLLDPLEFALSSGWRKANLVGLKRKHLSKKADGLWKINFKASEMKANMDFEHHCTQSETDIINRNISLEHEYIFRRDKKINGALDKGLGDFKKSFEATRKRCGFYWTWHWLRHTCSTMYGVSGFSEAQMNSLMSWSPKSRMAGNYTHMRNENLVNLRQANENLCHHTATKKNIEHTS